MTPDLGTMHGRESGVGDQVVGRVGECLQARHRATSGVNGSSRPRMSSRSACARSWSGWANTVWMSCGDELELLVPGSGQQVAHRVGAAAFSGAALQGPANRSGKPTVCVGEQKLHAGEPAVGEVAETLGPKRLVL